MDFGSGLWTRPLELDLDCDNLNDFLFKVFKFLFYLSDFSRVCGVAP